LINGQSVLAVIPARGGSKGLPGKNILKLKDKPLLAWTIEAAKESKYLDHVIVSTDNDDISKAAKDYGCDVPFLRPHELATDEASIYDVLVHALDQLKDSYDVLVLLQPTSPLRTFKDIDACLQILSDSNAPSCVSVCETSKSPNWMYWLDKENHLTPILQGGDTTSRRQDLAPAYVVNGAVYAANVSWFKEHMTFTDKKTQAYAMPRERSVDIDSEWDMAITQAALSYKG
jgi:CMP-N,N'-diacetyllegionaminic acid synthase